MTSDSFDWALAKSFVAVLDAGSVMGAARKLGAQQPTISRHIAELEEQLKAPLFERTGRGVVPTLAALAIEQSARDMQAGAEQLILKLSGTQTRAQGKVRISTSEVAASYLLPTVLARLALADPQISIELVASNALTNLLRREADIAVRMLRPAQSSLLARKLGDIPIVACAHESYLARRGWPKHPEELLKHQLIGYDQDDTMLRGFSALGMPVTREHFAMRTDSQVTYGRLIAQGLGIGFLARYNLKYLPGVVPVLPQLAVPPLPCWLAVHREIKGNPLVRKVYDFLADGVREELLN